MTTKRIIPCLDVKDGKTVKGINFVDIKDVGDPVELGKRYAEMGADELVFLDITATNEKRKTLTELVTRVASEINIPFTVGGGIASVEDVRNLLNCGADKISVNTAAASKRAPDAATSGLQLSSSVPSGSRGAMSMTANRACSAPPSEVVSAAASTASQRAM